MLRRPGNSHFALPRRSARAGFTLIELLVALVVLDIGLLALVGLSAAITRLAATDRAAFRAVAMASARIERLASVPCAGAVAVAQPLSSGGAEVFTDTPAPNGTRRITDSVAVTTARGRRIVVLTSGARC